MLDEPNANLDHEGEEALPRALRDLKADGVTVVVIAHRPSLSRGVGQAAGAKRRRGASFGPRAEVMARVTAAGGMRPGIRKPEGVSRSGLLVIVTRRDRPGTVGLLGAAFRRDHRARLRQGRPQPQGGAAPGRRHRARGARARRRPGHQGQELVLLDDVRIDAQLDLLRTQLDAERAKSARLEAERSLAARADVPAELLTQDESRSPSPSAREALFRARREALDSQIAVLRRQIRETGGGGRRARRADRRRGARAQAAEGRARRQRAAAEPGLRAENAPADAAARGRRVRGAARASGAPSFPSRASAPPSSSFASCRCAIPMCRARPTS